MNELGSKIDIPIDLVEQVERQRCVVFAGPGVSIPEDDRLGPPGPALLALELANRLGVRLDNYSLPWITQFYADRIGVHALREYIAGRLSDVRYQPTEAHHWLVRIPFHNIVYTAQDGLLFEAFRQHQVPVNDVLESGSLRYGPARSVIQLYGTAMRPNTLRLTEDECRQVFEHGSDFVDFLQLHSKNSTVLFLGYLLNDPFFREFYYRLRPQVDRYFPRAYLVQSGDNEDEWKYWQERNATVLAMNPLEFQQQLAAKLAQRGIVSVLPDTDYAAPPPMPTEERIRREQTVQAFYQQFNPVSSIESGEQLRAMFSGLDPLKQVIAEERMNRDSGERTNANHEEYTAQILLQQGNIAWAEGNPAQARTYFEDAVDKDPDNIDGYLSLYYLLVEMGELADALGVYRRMLLRKSDQAFLPAHYEIQQILGQTAIGISYHVFDTEQQQPVTITILRQALSRPNEVLNPFVEELRHIPSKHISHLLGYDRYHGRSYLITEYIEGTILHHQLQTTGSIPLHEAMAIIDQVAEALETAHQQGVPHLNLQSDNVILSHENVVLVNYGFSRLRHLGQSTGRLPTQVGGEYLAPEEQMGKIGDARSDVYALGTLLYEMLIGRPPGVGAVEKIGELYPQFGEAIDVLIGHARALDPDSRFQSITEMRRELQRIALSMNTDRTGQYLRLSLARISALHANVFTKRGAFIVLLMMVAIIMVEVSSWAMLFHLKGIGRLSVLLLTNGLMAGTLGYYIVRETARQEGLGSLIASGRAMGMLYGWLFFFWLYRLTDWSTISLQELDILDFTGYLFLSLASVVIVTFGAFVLLRNLGQLTRRWWGQYTRGFYAGFLLICCLVFMLALLKLPFIVIWY